MYFEDHNPPHVHVVTRDSEAFVAISDGEILAGSIPAKFRRQALNWIAGNREMLVALWDGKPGRGMGGTADMVHFAREQGRPLIWVNSETREVQQFNVGPEILIDSEMRFLNGLPDPSAPLPSGFPRD